MPIIAGPGSPGTTVVLDRLWLNSTDDPDDAMSFRISSWTWGKTVAGDVRELGGGRLRLVTRPTRAQRESAVIVDPTADQLAWLDDHAGQTLTVRDPDGGKFAATYLDLSWDRPVDGLPACTLQVQQVTVREAV